MRSRAGENGFSGAIAGVAFAFCCACARPNSVADEPRSSPSTQHSSSDPQLSKASWLLHPLTKLPATARLELTQGTLLEVDAGGSRWLSVGNTAPRASAFSAPEALSGLLRSDSGWAAVGQSGALYFFDEPLGPFVQTRTPPQTFEMTHVVGKTLVSLSADGRIFRSADAARSFQPVSAVGFFADLASDSRGWVYAVAVPEQWYVSKDAGLHFSLTALPPVAPLAMSLGADHSLVVRGLFGAFTPAGDRWVSSFSDSKAPENVQLPTFARVSQVEHRTALLSERGYWGLVSASDQEFRLEQGQLDQELKVSKIPRPAACITYQLFGDARLPLLQCKAENEGVSPPLRLYRWAPDENRWSDLSLPLRAAQDSLEVRHAPNGELFLWGVCPPHASEEGCSPSGYVRVREKKTEFFQLPGADELLDLGFDGTSRGWALVRRKKDNHLLVFGPLSSSAPPPQFDLTAQEPSFLVDQKQEGQLLLGDEQLVTVVARRSGAVQLAQLSSGLELLSVGRAPSGTSLVHGTGRRLAAVDVRKDLYWESTTGGILWTKQGLPSRLCHSEPCSVHLRCNAHGCLVGDELVRVGFFGTGVPSVEPPSSLLGSDEPPKMMDQLSCALAEAKFRTFQGVWGVPSAQDAWLGDSVWFAMSGNEPSATASVLSVSGRGGGVQQTPLFPPSAGSQSFVMKYFPQVEGSAVLRFPVRSGTQDLNGPVEVAWDNRLEGQTEHVVVGLGGSGPGAELRLDTQLQPIMMSVAGRGIFVQFAQDQEHSAYYLPGAGAAPERVAASPWPKLADTGYDPSLLATLTRGARSEAVFAHQQRSSLFLLANSRVVVRQMQTDSGSEFVPSLLGALHAGPGTSGHLVHLSYRGRDVGFLSVQFDEQGEARRAHFVELGEKTAFLPPVAAALPRYLPPRPQLCDEATRRTTPRVIAAQPSGQLRTVIVAGVEQRPIELRVEEMVLFGSPEQPCLGVWEARTSTSLDQAQYSALVAPGKAGGSWLFRLSRSEGSEQELGVQPMTCSFE